MNLSTVIVGAICGSFLATGAVAYLTQAWTEAREQRNRRYDLMLKVYWSVIKLIADYEFLFASAGHEGGDVPTAIQSRKIQIRHKLRLIASDETLKAYNAFTGSAFKQVAYAVKDRPGRTETEAVREALIDAMAADLRVQAPLTDRFWRQFDECFQPPT